DKIQQTLARQTPDLRQFEWYYWNRQIHGERRALSFKGERNDSDRTNIVREWMLNETGTRAVALGREDDGDMATGTTPFQCFVEFYDTVENKFLGRRKMIAARVAQEFGLSTRACLSNDGNRFVLGLMKVPGGRPEIKEIEVIDLNSDQPVFRRS